MLNWYRALLPREEKFVDNFQAHAAHIVAAAESLRAIIAGTATFDSALRAICEHEGAADAITKTTIEAIHRTFITPFDRTDIHDLITALDDTIDLIEEIAQRIAIYRLKSYTPQMLKLAEIAQDCAVQICEALPLLREITRNAGSLRALGARISVLEGQGDATLREGLGNLMHSGGDPIALITCKEIYELLEDVVDRCQDVSDVIQGIVIEHV